MNPLHLLGRSAAEKDYQAQRRASRKARARIVVEEFFLVALMGGVLVFGGYLLLDSFGGSHERSDQSPAGKPAKTATKDNNRAAGTTPEVVGDGAGMPSAPNPADQNTPRQAAVTESPTRPPAKTPRGNDTGTPTQPGAAENPRPKPGQSDNDEAAPAEPATPADAGPTDAGDGDVATEKSESAATTVQVTEAKVVETQVRNESGQRRPQAQGDGTTNGGGAKSREETGATTVGPAAASAPEITVERATFTYDVVYDQPRTPVTYIDHARTQAGRVYFFSEVDAPRETVLTHQWRHDGRVVAEHRFRVAGNDATSVSHHNLPGEATGTWRVYVRDGNGNTLKIGTALLE